MKLNRFEIRIVLQSVVIAFMGFFTVWFFIYDHLWVTRITSFIIWLALLINIINYTRRTNVRIKNFLSSVNYLDLLPADDEGDPSFRELNDTLNEVINTLKKAKIENEIQTQYFRNTVEHIHTGLITFNNEGKVKIYNNAARKLLGIPAIQDIKILSELKKGIHEKVTELKPGDNLLISLLIRGNLHKILIRKTKIKIQGEEINVISLQDIRSQLEEEELETWQKLIRTLRHEIMNSIAPLNSLSISLKKLVGGMKNKIPPQEAGMLLQGLEVISRRSGGLIEFVTAYKTLSSLPKPEFSEFSAILLLEECKALFQPEADRKKIKIFILGNKSIRLTADYNLISQIIINLIKNATEAIGEGGKIQLYIFNDESRTSHISIKDDGKGIGEDQIEEIFVPFYTTKENGTGIGLSFARQIMRMHRGHIKVYSEQGKGAEFVLTF